MKRRLTALLGVVAVVFGGASFVSASHRSVAIECTDPSGPAVVLCDVYADPNVHAGSLGTTLFHATGATKATVPVPDTASRVAVRSEASVSGGTNTAIFVVNYGHECQDGWTSVGYQAWWADTGQDPAFESRHAHIDNVCIPGPGTIVDGPTTFDFVVQLHNQPAGAEFTRLRVKDYCSGSGCAVDGKGSGSDVFASTTSLPQPDANGNLAHPFSITLDLSTADTGRHELRFGVYVTQPDGKVQLLSSRTQVNVRGTSPTYRSLSTYPLGAQGVGAWYEKDTDPGYVDAKVISGFAPSNGGPTPAPATPTLVPTPSPTLPSLPPPSSC